MNDFLKKELEEQGLRISPSHGSFGIVLDIDENYGKLVSGYYETREKAEQALCRLLVKTLKDKIVDESENNKR